MLDVHPPHNPTHTWRDFLLHIATIVIGLFIAVGLEQTVEHRSAWVSIYQIYIFKIQILPQSPTATQFLIEINNLCPEIHPCSPQKKCPPHVFGPPLTSMFSGLYAKKGGRGGYPAPSQPDKLTKLPFRTRSPS
jgi:hypothetical protein